MTKKQTNVKMVEAKQAGLEKFRRYAKPRLIDIDEATYGIRTVTHGKKTTQLEAVDAVCAGVEGWIVNLANRQRKFVSVKDNYYVSSKIQY